MLTIASSTPMLTDRCGTKATSSARRMVRSTSRLYTNVATKVPSTTWLAVSRMKLRSRRGPNCDEASDIATSVIENTVPAMAIIDPATVPSSRLAPSAPPE